MIYLSVWLCFPPLSLCGSRYGMATVGLLDYGSCSLILGRALHELRFARNISIDPPDLCKLWGFVWALVFAGSLSYFAV